MPPKSAVKSNDCAIAYDGRGVFTSDRNKSELSNKVYNQTEDCEATGDGYQYREKNCGREYAKLHATGNKNENGNETQRGIHCNKNQRGNNLRKPAFQGF